MRDNDVKYKINDFNDRMFLLDGIEYSGEELFNKFMEEEHGK